MRNAWLIRPVPHGIPRVTEFKREGDHCCWLALVLEI